jgi:uncharacterized protein YodC (DUF2158 family)
MSDIKAGDRVQVKSGGPTMTVESIGKDGTVYCVWFDGSTEKKSNFNSASLQKVDVAE